MDRLYLCIDLKTFYASVECAERKLDPFTTNLVVANPSRGKGAICLAITPALKALGIKNRCRLFEIPSDVNYITAMPRMKLYMQYSTNIYKLYLKYFAKEDILVYSIDECFIEVTPYLKLYNIDYICLAKMIMDDVYNTFRISAQVGIGTNLFLAKVALDVTAKHSPNQIGFLDLDLFKHTMWYHTPLTDIWGIGKGISKRLHKHRIYSLYRLAHIDEEIIFKEFGINGRILIDHARGIEPCSILDVKSYVPKANSFSSQQILFEDYEYNDALLVLKEMVELGVQRLIKNRVVCGGVSLYVGYSKDIHKASKGSFKLYEFTNSHFKLNEYFIGLFHKIVKNDIPIRKIGIGFNNIVDQSYKTINLFTDFSKEQKEENLQKSILKIKEKYGKNAILKGMNLQSKATTTKRNELIGGHNAN